ncbi:hypothetical protein QBC44DRAFT_371984 [Cladorrhinum sp. PSN332]|nr:hypothetical protein QBC44DRAFT_371984 [Cladorrhinum sp. PSN332]
MFSKLFITAALVALALAVPSPAREVEVTVENGFALLNTHVTTQGWTVTYWGPNSTETAEVEHPLERRQCGSRIIDCHTSNIPTVLATQNLLFCLQNSGGSQVPNAPRSVCLTSNGQRACASWSVDVGTVTVVWLHNAARAAFDQCVNNGRSGRVRPVMLGSRCTSQCLSDRPDGC